MSAAAPSVQVAAGEPGVAAASVYDADELHALADLGYALLAEGRLADARTLWEGVAMADPQGEAAWRALAVIAARERRWADVEPLATAALGRRPGAAGLLLRAEARWRIGRYADAALDLEAIARVVPQGEDERAISRRAAALHARLRRPGA
jgi:tetratricopeptide (TPR) repeat protein